MFEDEWKNGIVQFLTRSISFVLVFSNSLDAVCIQDRSNEDNEGKALGIPTMSYPSMNWEWT